MKGKVFWKRSLALVLAAALLLSNMNGLAVLTDAADNATTTKTLAELIAENYTLSDAEEAILNSGYLVCESYTYDTPTADNNLVKVDTENFKITADSFKTGERKWVPTKAVIEYGGKQLTVDLTDGVGTYDPDVVGNAFSVKVTYDLSITASKEDQVALLDTIAALKQGVANLDAVADQAGNLEMLETIMPQLVEMAENGVSAGMFSSTFEDRTIDVVNKMNAQMTANGGLLNMSVMINEFNAATKTAFLVGKGAAMYTELATLASYAEALDVEFAMWQEIANGKWGEQIPEATRNQINTIANFASSFNDALAVIAADPWTIANNPGVISTGANYAILDVLVADLGVATSVSYKDTLAVDTTTIQKNLSMWNVTVAVVLNTVNSSNQVAQYDVKTVELTLADKATAAEILAAVEASGIEKAAISAWGSTYVADKYEASESALPETLTEDITYTITYNPKNFTVEIEGVSKTAYPYGSQFVLPVHADSTKAYDYYLGGKGGDYYAQGSILVVKGDMLFIRSEGDAYSSNDLLGILADNYASHGKLANILSAGALLMNEPVNYREPKDLNALVELNGTTLTAQTVVSSYEGLKWAPYSYVVDGDEHKFEGKTEVTVPSDFDSIHVYYRLTLTNYAVPEIQKILNLMATLANDAANQHSVLTSLNNQRENLTNISMLSQLNALIQGDETVDAATKAHFDTVTKAIKADCMSGSDLKLYTLLVAYNDAKQSGNHLGLAYYYQNADAFIKELTLLSGYLEDLMGENGQYKEFLKSFIASMGSQFAEYADYVDKFDEIKDDLTNLLNKLTTPNAAIDTASSDLAALCKALLAGTFTAPTVTEHPYVSKGYAEILPATKSSVKIEVKVNGKSEIYSFTKENGEIITAEDIAALKNSVAAFIEEKLKGNDRFYTNDYNNGAALDALVNTALNSNQTFTSTWTAKTYTVKIDGENDQTISVNNLLVNLPGHSTNGFIYEYTIGGKVYNAGNYEFTLDQIDSLFVNGVCTISREEINIGVKKLEEFVADVNAAMGYEALILVGKNGEYTGIVANMSISDLMTFVQALATSDYKYIGLNGEGLYEDDLISIQTLINALLHENNEKHFNSDAIINLGQNGKGTLLTADLKLGSSAGAIEYDGLSFEIKVTSVPSQFVTAANALKAVKSYISFKSENGILLLNLNLPDAVYGAYLTALTATGHVDKSDINAVNQEIAFRFLYDYILALTNMDVTGDTLANTLAMFGQTINGDTAETYYNYFCKFLAEDSKYSEISIDEQGMTVGLTLPGKGLINNLLKLMGMSSSEMGALLNAIKEYNGSITANAKAELVNPSKNILAMIVDLNASGLINKYDCASTVSSLAGRVQKLAGYSAVLMLTDVVTDLNFSGTTILDLNGKTITGNVSTTGTLYIVDSSMDTVNCGSITGGISGNVVILSGNYKTDVTEYLKAGYYQENGTVRNELYHIEDENGKVTFVIDTDVFTVGSIPAAQALAIDIATDLILNYITAASLTVDGNDVYGVALTDLLGLLNSDTTADDAIMKVLNSINVPGISEVINLILDKVCDFAEIEEAIKYNKPLGNLDMITHPWAVEIEHITNGDYLTVSVVANENITKTFTIALKLEGDNADQVAELAGALKDIADVDINVDLQQPTYADKHFSFSGKLDAMAKFDMSKNSDYATIVTVILAYGNSSKRAAVAEAINSGDMAKLQAIVDETTVAEIITALKVLARGTDFAQMATAVGITVDINSAAKLEAVYHVFLCALGKALEVADITGSNAVLGDKYDELTGYYAISKEDISRNGKVTVGAYSAMYDVALDALYVGVKLFDEIEEHVHNYTGITVEKEATCCETGLEYHHCACGDFIEVTTEKNPDNHAGGTYEKVHKEATEKEPGEVGVYCKGCDKLLETNTVPYTGDYMIYYVSIVALAALLGLVAVQLIFKRRFFN